MQAAGSHKPMRRVEKGLRIYTEFDEKEKKDSRPENAVADNFQGGGPFKGFKKDWEGAPGQIGGQTKNNTKTSRLIPV